MKHLSFLIVLFFLSVLQVSAGGFDSNPDHHLGFVENKGQIHDQNGNERSDVKFVFSQGDFKLILRNDGFSFELVKTIPESGSFPESGIFNNQDEDDEYSDMAFRNIFNRVDVTLQQCNKNVEIIGENPSPSYLNYFNQYTGTAGITHVRNFSRVVYKNIYDHIDLVFSLEKRDGKIIPKYEFAVNAGGNISDIRLTNSGQDEFSISKDGSLEIKTPLGFISESEPIVLSPERKILQPIKFVRRGNSISFSKCNTAHSPFIIDPEIAWGTYYGGMKRDLTDEIACDHLGNIFLTGRTQSTDQIATAGAYQTYNAGYNDAPLVKFDGDGNLLWATYYGGETNDVAFAITVDPFNNAWIGGRTISTAGIATADAFVDTFSGGEFDVFVAKFSPDGMLLYGTYMGDSLKDEVQGLCSNKDGDIYVSGYSESISAMSTVGAWKQTGSLEGESFLEKFSNDGHLLWGTYFGGEKRDRGHGVCVDGYGHLFQFGTTNSHHGIATTGAYQDHNNGLNDVFLIKWTEDGQLIWSTFFGGEGDDRGRDVRVDMAGNVYGVGQTESDSNIATPGVFKDTLHYLPTHDRDAFVVKFDSNGNRIWCTYFGGNKIDMPRSLRVTRDGATIYIAGYTLSDQDFSTPNAYNIRRGGGNDAFFAMINWDATKLLYSTYYGGRNSESITQGGWYGPTMDLDPDGNIFISSGTDSPDSIATPNGYKTYVNDTTEYDLFVAKFNNPCIDGYEPENDSIDTAPPLLYNTSTHSYSYRATIESKKDKDYFSFTKPPYFDNIKVTLTDLPADYNLWVYDENKNLLAKSQNSGTEDESVFIPDTYFSKYYVFIKSPLHEYDAFNCYNLNIYLSMIAKESDNEIPSAPETIYPNPADDVARLDMNRIVEGTYRIQIMNELGLTLLDEDHHFTPDENSLDIAVSSFPSGNYLVRIKGKDFSDGMKLIVQH
ncbi:MAG: T9SS type A sorting domain-containing protein [Chitinophagales bacterium]